MKAFPLSTEKNYGQDGMDLRDYFAAKALMSMLAPVQDITENTANVAATWAYKFADAMMKVRQND